MFSQYIYIYIYIYIKMNTIKTNFAEIFAITFILCIIHINLHIFKIISN